jgi:hypothetical protein
MFRAKSCARSRRWPHPSPSHDHPMIMIVQLSDWPSLSATAATSVSCHSHSSGSDPSAGRLALKLDALGRRRAGAAGPGAALRAPAGPRWPRQPGPGQDWPRRPSASAAVCGVALGPGTQRACLLLPRGATTAAAFRVETVGGRAESIPKLSPWQKNMQLL